MEKAQSKSGILTEKLKIKLKNEHCKDDRQEDGTDVGQEEDGTDVGQEEDGTDVGQEEEGTDVGQEEDGTDGSQEEDDTDDRCNKTEEASLFYGPHEIQELSEGGEVDLSGFSCKKNPGHTKFVPVNDFKINHLPEGHRDEDLVEYIKAIADLTVRVAVKKVSTGSPEFWRDTNQPYPFYDKSESDVRRLGTGMVWNVNKWTEEDIKKHNKGTCQCHKCQHPESTPSKVWGVVRMCTARHVVSDDRKARHTTCRLFFDRQDSPLVTLDGWRVLWADSEEDWCVLDCVTCDVELLDKLDKMWRHWDDLWKKVENKYENSRDMDKLTFIVSHPHGCPKHISVGQWIDRREVSDDKTKYTYKTCTCPGSSGAHVHSLGYDGRLLHGRHIHSGVNSKGDNYSTTGRDRPYYL